MKLLHKKTLLTTVSAIALMSHACAAANDLTETPGASSSASKVEVLTQDTLPTQSIDYSSPEMIRLEDGRYVIYSTPAGLIENKVRINRALRAQPNLQLVLKVEGTVSLSSSDLPRELKNLKLTNDGAPLVIGDNFLRDCSTLTSLDLSDLSNVISIGHSFLCDCGSLTSLDLSPLSSVTSIGDYFLAYCGNIPSLDLKGLSNVTSIGNYFLAGCGSLTSLDLSPLSRVNSLGNYFLWHCSRLSSLDLSPLSNMTSIGSRFLHDCTHLTYLNLSGPSNEFLIRSLVPNLTNDEITNLQNFLRNPVGSQADDYLFNQIGILDHRILMHHLNARLIADQMAGITTTIDSINNLLNSSDRDTLTRICNFIRGNHEHLGWPKEHELVQTATARLTVPNQDQNDFLSNLYNVSGEYGDLDDRLLIPRLIVQLFADPINTMNCINDLLHSSDPDTLTRFCNFIHNNHEDLGWPEEHELVQTARARLTVLNLDQTDPHNPWRIWNDLKRKREETVDLKAIAPNNAMLVGNTMVTFNPEALARFSDNMEIDPTTVPPVTAEDLANAMEAIQEKLTPGIESEISEITAPHGQTTFNALNIKARSPFITSLLNGDSVVSSQLKCLLNYALTCPESNTATSAPSLSNAEKQLILTLSTIRNCGMGQNGDIVEFYSNLSFDYKFQTRKGTLATTLEAERAQNLVKDIIRECLDDLIGDDNEFMKSICGETGPIEQLAHQVHYLRNLISPEMGSNRPMNFDHHAQCLYLPLINRTKEEVLTELYRYILSENRFISAIQHKINHAVKTKSAYTTLFELTKEWVDFENKEETDDVTKMYTKNITEQGVTDLLLSVGVLEKSDSLFAG